MHRVETGLDRLLRDGPAVAGLRRKSRIGLLAHPASVDRRARPAVDLLAVGDTFDVVRLFAPEHGLEGHLQDMESVARSRDGATGAAVVSLYGEDADSLRPDPGDLADLDAILVDLQDVGSRYYTFVYTLSFVMEGAARSGLPVVCLDRPNPIGGQVLEGPVLHPELASFVGRYPIPVRHGMTIGELATLFDDAFGIGCDLRVVRMSGWERGMHFEETGLPWVPPSPNMPSPATARVYPGGCLVEGTNLSEGRGTTLPFELVGAPWLDARAVLRSLEQEGFEGVLLRPASLRPMFHKHAGEVCHGVHVIPTAPRDRFRPFAVYLALIREARRLHPRAFRWREEAYEFERDRLAIDLLLGREDLRPLVESGAALGEMERCWREELERFADLRERYLTYG